MYDYDLEDQADELAQKIIKRYKGHGVAIDIKDNGIKILKDRFVYRIKLLSGTRVNDIKKYAKDVRMSLKLLLFQVVEESTSILIVTSKEFVFNNNLLNIFTTPEYIAAKKTMQIPHLVGFDATRKPVIADLTKYPHLMASGTTGSGKTVGLKILLLSVILGCSPNKARLLICDKAAEFEDFSEIPHLSYPIITDSNTFLKVMLTLRNEMERRVVIKKSKNEEFPHLPTIVCVVDEFLSFISEVGAKELINLAADTISAILRRGRHVKIHMVLAAHNPTQKNMLIDLSDIASRMAFRCAKPANSVTILGEGGADKLEGDGDMLFRPANNAPLQRVQGAFISPENMEAVLNQIRLDYDNRSPKKIERDRFFNLKYGFAINEEDLNPAEVADEYSPTVHSKTDNEIDNQLFAEIVIWALENELISGNMICDAFHLGWKRGSRFLEKLHELGIVGDLYAKLPRAVLPICLEDLSPRIVGFLKRHGYTSEHIEEVIVNSKGGRMTHQSQPISS